jgi:hypothetical protein
VAFRRSATLPKLNREKFMAESNRLSFVQWAVCVIAVIGFAFDTYELLVLPLILGPAVQELLGQASDCLADTSPIALAAGAF